MTTLTQAAPRMLRLGTQTALAALVTFGITQTLSLPEASWGVISALFTVQQSVGGTLTAAVGRLIGVALGTALGIGCAILIGVSPWQAAIGLLLIAAVINAIAAVFPSTQFGVVVGAILLIVPEGDPLEQGLQRGLTIGIGTAVGTLAALFVFPESAHRKTQQHLGSALRRCGDLLATGIALLTGGKGERLQPIHADIRRDLAGAAEMAEQSLHPHLSPQDKAPEPETLLRATERLWHTLIMVDRAEDGPLPDGPREQLAPALHGLAEASCAYLQGLGESVAKNRPPPPQDQVRRRLQALDRALEEMREAGHTRPLEAAEAERVFALSFALRHLTRDLERLAEAADRPHAG